MPGVLTGKQKTAGSYVPYIYTKSQQDWVSNFYQQNGYLEFQTMVRMGISDPAGFIQKTLSRANLLILPSVAVGPAILDQVEAALDEAVSSASYVKLLQILPSVFEDSDAEALLQKVVQKKNASQNLHVFNSTVVVTDQYMKTLLKKYDEALEDLAKKYVKSGEYVKHMIEKNTSKGLLDEKVDTKADRKEERRKKASEGKGGGGTQGRETKTKSTKKKYLKGKNQQEDSEDEEKGSRGGNVRVEVVTRDDVLAGLQGEELLQEEDEDTLLEELTTYLHPTLNR